MTWVTTNSPNFSARHQDSERRDAGAVLEHLEITRAKLIPLFAKMPEDVAVVLHPSTPMLMLAHPQMLYLYLRTAKTGRRYQTGWFSEHELHVVSPKALRSRSGSEDASKALELASSCELARLVVGLNNPVLPPPFGVSSSLSLIRNAWLVDGAARYLVGQTQYLAPAVRLRLKDPKPPALPPSIADVPLISGLIFAMLEQQCGSDACLKLCCANPDQPRKALQEAFDLSWTEIESLWHEQLANSAPTETPKTLVT